MLYIIIFVLLLAFIILFQLVIRGFKNPQKKHSKTPESIGIAFEEIRIPTANNRNLYGWLIMQNPAAPTLILVHGWGRNVERMIPYIRPLFKTNCNLLAFDARHHGNSDNDDHSTMKKFAEDIIASINFVIAKTPVTNPDFGIIGLSIGGGASIYAAAHDDRIKSVVTVGAFANPHDIMRDQMASNHIPYRPFGKLLFMYLENRVGFKFQDISPEKHIHKSDAKFLLIHGEDDKTIPLSHVTRLEKSGKKGNILSWKIPGKGHSDCHFEPGYWERITQFINGTLS